MAKKNEGKSKGRPTKYTKAIADKICEQLSEGRSLRRICAEDEMLPAESTVRKWAIDDYHGFYAQYARARDIGLDSMADETLDIADDSENDYITKQRADGSEYETLDREAVMRSALRVDTRKWYLSKLAPKRYDKPVSDDEDKDNKDIPEEYTLSPDEGAPDNAVL